MKKKGFVFIVTCLLACPLFSQHLIGLGKEQLITAMEKYYPSFDIDNSSVNNTYKYLKYIDKFREQTMLVFLSENDKCTATKLMSDYSNLAQVKDKLNKTYKLYGKDKWVYKINGITYLITLKREDWFFSVFTSKKEK
jgi:hypothetical protein